MIDQLGFGLLRKPDERDRNFALPRRLVPRHVTSKFWLSLGEPLDQGPTSQCVIYAADKWLTTRPVVNRGFMTADARMGVYREVQRIDEWPGENYDGTSVRALFKYLKQIGLVAEYRWAFDLETAIGHLLTTGPLVMGTNWYRGMADPDSNGYIWPTGSNDGGHAWVALGANRTRRNPDATHGAVRMVNSWGPNWGPHKGKAWLSFDSFKRLIAEDGEAATATEVKQV